MNAEGRPGRSRLGGGLREKGGRVEVLGMFKRHYLHETRSYVQRKYTRFCNLKNI